MGFWARHGLRAKLIPVPNPLKGDPNVPHPPRHPRRRRRQPRPDGRPCGRPGGGEIAPRSGTIKRIRLIAGGPGVFRLQVAKVKHSRLYGSSQVKVLADGPKIQYEGQTEANWESDSYRIETFDVDVPIKKGEQLAMHVGGSTSAIRCSSGGDNTLIHLGGKYPRQPFSPVTGDDGCWVLIEAVIR